MSRRFVLLAVLGLVTMFTVAACSGQTATVDPIQKVSASEAVKMLDERTVIDVRTPAEYATGHISGAINIDVEAPDFSDRIAELDPEEPYLVYCHSGRRAAIAADEMAAANFTDIVDGGGIGDLADAGAAIES